MSRLYNFFAVAMLIAWNGWNIWQTATSYVLNYHAHSSGLSDTLFVLQTIAQAAGIAYASFIILLVIVRDTPRARAQGFVPNLAAILGSFATVTFFIIPAARIAIPLLIISIVCIAIGLGLSIYTLIYLGRSFALLPSARMLVTNGPYAFIRHPLYLFEEIAVFGIMIQFTQPLSIVVMGVQLIAQFMRMHYEEKILMETFPEYVTYAARTARLIPGIY